MTALEAIRAINAALAVATNSYQTAQRIGATLERAQAEGRDITADEWNAIVGEADAADARLGAAIRDAGPGRG